MIEAIPAQTSSSVIKNVIYGSLTLILPLFLSLAATPLLIRSLGVETYGIYALVIGLIAYSFNFGFGRAAVKYIAEYRISGDVPGIRAIFSGTILVSVIVGLFGLLLVIGLADKIVTDVLLIGQENRQIAVVAIRIAGVVIFVSTINQVFWSSIQGAQRFDVYSKLFNANSFIFLSGNLLLAALGYGLVTLIWWNLISLTLMTAISAVASKKIVPQIGLSLSDGLSAAPRVISFTSGIVGYQILGSALVLIERGWITRAFGTEDLAYYVVAMTLGLYIHGFANSLSLTIAPLTSESRNNPNRLSAVYLRTTKFLLIIVGFIFTALYVGNHAFLSLWIGPEFADRAAPLLSVHLISFSLLAVSVVSWQMREGLGFPSHNLYIFAFCFVLTLALIYLLTAEWGVMGVAFARAAGCVYLALTILHFEKWLFGKIEFNFWLKNLVAVGAAMAAAGAAQAFLLSLMYDGWSSLITSVAAAGIVYLGALWLFRVISSDEIRLVRETFQR